MPLQWEAARGQLLCFQTRVIAFTLSFLLLSFTTCAHNEKHGLNSLMQASHYSFTYSMMHCQADSITRIDIMCVQIFLFLVGLRFLFFLSTHCFLLLICLCGHKSKMSPWVLFDAASWQLIEELWDWHLSRKMDG